MNRTGKIRRVGRKTVVYFYLSWSWRVEFNFTGW